ncbi:MAG: type III-B CRISPR-associated protein Cas10/Cmr2 [Calothrix sp. MO_192.B10]|nr:type III-B CRISPR-associated protein Cas10/Cmr2 [Calothrix sp. MO_192.B10]
MLLYQRKLYALLQAPEISNSNFIHFLKNAACLKDNFEELQEWWNENKLPQDIGSSSDRVNLHPRSDHQQGMVKVKHPISGQAQEINPLNLQEIDLLSIVPQEILQETDAKKVFWWFWRFYPEIIAARQSDALLFPAHKIIPDCPLHSYQNTVSALASAMYPKCWQKEEEHQKPYLLIFSFSPVQEFIKSSRKFLDFWAGSYLLHYLSAQLCWHIAQHLGPDAVIVPSLWSQEIIDALIVEEYPKFKSYFACLSADGQDPISRFNEKQSPSLSTAGFPNIITVLVPGKAGAEEWGQDLSEKLTEIWSQIGEEVRNDIRNKVITYLNSCDEKELLDEAFPSIDYSDPALDPYKEELTKLRQKSCWEWRKLWEAQLGHTWEPYWAAVPLGNPELPLFHKKDPINQQFPQDWINKQAQIAQTGTDSLPTSAETRVYDTLNVGTWWGSLQRRLGLCLNFVKNTRNWQIPTAPGERSTISGQFSAIHPCLNYQVKTSPEGKIKDLREGGGLPAGSMRLFWLIMSKAYPGLFNGTEKLNALEITKRMAWQYGDVATTLGIKTEFSEEYIPEDVAKDLEITSGTRPDPQKPEQYATTIDYEKLIRFPNVSSIAAARFVYDSILHNPQNSKVRKYWNSLVKEIKKSLGEEQRRIFASRTRCRPFHVPKTDAIINPDNQGGRNYNGVMFSSKWLADDMGLQETEARQLKSLIDQAHRAREVGFGDSSPADWWVIVLADGDGMGAYVTGEKLHNYSEYIIDSLVDKTNLNETDWQNLSNIQKRMGPATHVGLNRALLDFSNRLVPYLTEKRFCGRVIYSGGDDVMAVLPLEDLPEYLLCLRAAWCGQNDPYSNQEFTTSRNGTSSDKNTGYWHPNEKVEGLPHRPHFTMGKGATMSMGVVIAHKSVPLPTVLETLWEAESGRAKAMPGKDGICFRVIYGGGNQLEALMKGELLEQWWNWVKEFSTYQKDLSPLLYRLAEELPRRADITDNHQLFSQAAKVIMASRDQNKKLKVFPDIEEWLDHWENWAREANKPNDTDNSNTQPENQRREYALGSSPEELGKLLRFTAFWVDKRVERWQWIHGEEKTKT